MYTDYWGLKRKPFEIAGSPYFYYPGPTPQTVLLKLRYILESRRGSGLLSGAGGTGKSLLVSMLGEFRKKGASLGPILTVAAAPLSAEDFLYYLAEKVEPNLFSGESRVSDPDVAIPHSDDRPPVYRAFAALERYFLRLSGERKKPVLVIEGVERVRDPDVWAILKALVEIEFQGNPIVAVLLTASPELTVRPIPDFEDALETEAVLPPLSPEETEAMIPFRLRKAGREEEIFTPSALETIYGLTGGNPRKINRVCDLALLVGMAEKLQRLDDALVETLSRELINA